MNHHVNELGVCVKENEWQRMDKDGGNGAKGVKRMYCYLFISFLSSATYFQLVSCPFRLRLVILSSRFGGTQLLLFFISCAMCVCVRVFPLSFFVLFSSCSSISIPPCLVIQVWINRRETFYWQTQCTKSVCFTHGIFRFDTVKTVRFNANKWFHRNREVDYTFRQFQFHLPGIEHHPIVGNRNDNEQWHSWNSCTNSNDANTTVRRIKIEAFSSIWQLFAGKRTWLTVIIIEWKREKTKKAENSHIMSLRWIGWVLVGFFRPFPFSNICSSKLPTNTIWWFVWRSSFVLRNWIGMK